MSACFFCDSPGVDVRDLGEIDGHDVTCSCCGHYRITEEAKETIRSWRAYYRMAIGCVIRERTECCQPIDLIRSKELEALKSQAPDQFDIAGKVRKLVKALGRATPSAGQSVTFGTIPDKAFAYANDEPEFTYLVQYGCALGWISAQKAGSSKFTGQQWKMTVSPSGWEMLRNIPRIESITAFIAMWFNTETDLAYQAISKAVDECGYKSMRVDAEEFNGDIVDRIRAGIRESRFLIADLTGHRPGVYYEAGYAEGMGLPVIWCCRKEEAEHTHFDTEHFNQIRWNNPEELRQRLTNRIIATIGRGPLTPSLQGQTS